jgi:hypothetical protein
MLLQGAPGESQDFLNGGVEVEGRVVDFSVGQLGPYAFDDVPGAAGVAADPPEYLAHLL